MTDILPSKALVTGATSGIGRAVALKLASDGFEVIVHGRDAERGAQTVKEIERSGGQARFLPADLGEAVVGKIQAQCLAAESAIAHLKILLVTAGRSDRIALTTSAGPATDAPASVANTCSSVARPC